MLAWLLLFGVTASTADVPLHATPPDLPTPSSPHAEHLARHPALPTSVAAPAPRHRAAHDRPDITVYGYWPYWGDPLDTIRYDELTHLALFGVNLESDGSVSDTHLWTDNVDEALALAAPYDVKIHVTLICFSDSVMGSVLPSPSRRAKAVGQLKGLVEDYGAHGVNIDCEGMDSYLKDDFTTFVQELSAEIDEVYLAMPSVDWSGAYDYDELALASDGLFLMAYGYHSQGGDPGPISPLHGGGSWSTYAIDWTVDDYQTYGAPKESLIVGLPLYGRDWPSTNTDVPGSRTGDGVAVVYSSAVDQGVQYGRRWDASTSTPYAFPDNKSQLWYDDQQSLHEKIQWAVDHELQGVGFWAITYENGDGALWDDIGEITRFDASSPPDTDLPDTDIGEDTSVADTDAPPGGQDTDNVGDGIHMPASAEAPSGCGCSASGAPAGLAVFGLPLIAMFRRRDP